MGLEMGPLSSPMVTSYRLPIVTIGGAISRHFLGAPVLSWTGGRMEFVVRRHYALKCFGRLKYYETFLSDMFLQSTIV